MIFHQIPNLNTYFFNCGTLNGNYWKSAPSGSSFRVAKTGTRPHRTTSIFKQFERRRRTLAAFKRVRFFVGPTPSRGRRRCPYVMRVGRGCAQNLANTTETTEITYAIPRPCDLHAASGCRLHCAPPLKKTPPRAPPPQNSSTPEGCRSPSARVCVQSGAHPRSN